VCLIKLKIAFFWARVSGQSILHLIEPCHLLLILPQNEDAEDAVRYLSHALRLLADIEDCSLEEMLGRIQDFVVGGDIDLVKAAQRSINPAPKQ
jgi:hypothetical protein